MAPYRELLGDSCDRPRPIDVRYVDCLRPTGRTGRAAAAPAGVARAPTAACPTIRVLHACVLTYASDMTLLDTTLLPHGVSTFDQRIMMASLDHAMWFHRPFRADEWLLYDQDTPSTHGGRGLACGSIFTRDGRLAVVVVQEGLIRRNRP